MRESPTFLYFAYGSNMLTQRLRERTPSARVVSAAALHGHALRWHKVSRDGSAKCDAVPAAPDSVVHGVVFEIDRAEKPALDLAEGIGMGYREKIVEVATERGPLQAWTYQATNTDHLALPYTWYRSLVVAGAKEHGLPQDYVAALEATRTKVDPDEERAAQNLRFTQGPEVAAAVDGT